MFRLSQAGRSLSRGSRETQSDRDLRTPYMINPNGDEFKGTDPITSPMGGGSEPVPPGAENRWRETAGRVSDAAGSAWEQTKERAITARERTEFYVRENPVPTVIGALVLGLAIGLAIRYASDTDEKEVEVKSPLGNVDLSVLTLPFLWPFFKSVRRRAEDAADVAKDGVQRLKKIDVDDYVKPLRKKWKSWAN